MKTSIQNIKFSETQYFSKLILDYINGEETIAEFYGLKKSIDSFEQNIQYKKQENLDRKLLTNVIQQQYQSIPEDKIKPNVLTHIELLNLENTFCVVTAHQLNIFGGPLYYIYKIAQTISTCKQLKQKYPNYNFVPVYWLGSEDHDFEEINHIYLYNKKIEWIDTQKGATGSFNTQNILPLIDEIENILGNQTYTEALISIFREAYQQNNLATATRFLVNELFGEFGLVVIDGNDASLKKQFSSIMYDELFGNNSYKLVQKSIEALNQKAYKIQANPRLINLFYLHKYIRERIEYNAFTQRYEVLNTSISFTKNELEQELKLFPERFSPNVILRPLMQQKLLPSIAYIGGAGELAYWLQLKSTFDFYQVNFPILMLRNSALLVQQNLNQKIQKLGFDTITFFLDVEELKKKFIQNNTTFSLEKEHEKILQEFDMLKEKTSTIDASLVGYVAAESQKVNKIIENIETRVLKSLKQKNELNLNQIEKIKNQLFPNQNLQERVENFSVYYAKYGQEFIINLIDNFDVFNKQFLLIDFADN